MAYKCGNCNRTLTGSPSHCPGCGSKLDYSGTEAGCLVAILFWIFLRLPFVLVGMLSGFLVWQYLDWSWQISLGVGIAAFAAALVFVHFIGILSFKVPKPFNYILRVLEFILVAGLQFLIVFSMAYSFFVPKDIQMELIKKQAAYMQKQPAMVEAMKKTGAAFGSDTLNQKMQQGEQGIKGIFNQLGGSLSFKDTARIFVESRKVYFGSMINIIKSGRGGQMIIGMIISGIIAFAIAFVIYILHLGKQRKRL